MTLLAVVGMQSEARVVGGPGVRVAVGGGRAEGLLGALNHAMEVGVTAVISVGIAGGLDPGLKVGDIVLGTEVLGGEGHFPTHDTWTDALAVVLPEARRGAVWGSASMVIDAGEKALLRQESGAVVVDMESYIAVRFARAHGLDFAVLRVVSDAAETNLPTAVLNGLKPDGRPNLGGVLAGLAKRPQELPALIQLGRDSEVALKALAAVRARVGPTFAHPIPRR